jgi:hypothetical protein
MLLLLWQLEDEELRVFRQKRAASAARRKRRQEEAEAGVSWGMDADAEEEPEEG